MASDEAREFSHHFTVGANLVVFSSLIWTVARGSMQAGPRRSCVRQWGPLFLVVTGCIVAMLDPMRHLLLDHGGVFFSPDALAMYVDGGPGLSLIGRFCQVSTVIGLCSLFVGMLCFLAIPEKVYEKVMEDASA